MWLWMLHGTHGGLPGAEGGKKQTSGEITTAFPSTLQNMGISLVSTSLCPFLDSWPWCPSGPNLWHWRGRSRKDSKSVWATVNSFTVFIVKKLQLEHGTLKIHNHRLFFQKREGETHIYKNCKHVHLNIHK